MTVEERISRLEEMIGTLKKTNRRLLIVTCLMGTAFLLIVTLGAASKQTGIQDNIRARHIELVGKDEAIYATLGLFGVDNEPRLELFDKDGKSRILLSVFKDEPGLDFNGKDGKPRVVLSVVMENYPVFSLNGENGKRLFNAP